MSSGFDICCEAWETGIQKPEDESFPCVMFSIQFFVTFNRYPVHEDELEGEVLDSSTYKFCVERDRLIDDNKSRSEVDGMLSAMHLPAQPFLIDRILNPARAIASDKRFLNYKVLRMNVSISVDSADDDGSDFMDDDIAMDPEFMGDIAMVPASRESIEKLATVEVKDSMKESCAVCFEELLVGSMAKCMPCSQSHIFHGNCIVKWLENGNSCPLCRFEMPC